MLAFAYAELLIEDRLAADLGVSPVDLARRPVTVELLELQVGVADRLAFAAIFTGLAGAGWE